MAIPNGLNPSVARLRLPGDVIITAGTSTDSASITLEIGTPGTNVKEGSLYICNATSTPKVFFASSQPVEWTQLTLN
jgi:hypothetical protein